MKSKKSYTLISLLMVILMLCGCARTDETIDVNYWRYKLKKPSSSSLLENAQNATQNAINKGADATERKLLAKSGRFNPEIPIAEPKRMAIIGGFISFLKDNLDFISAQ